MIGMKWGYKLRTGVAALLILFSIGEFTVYAENEYSSKRYLSVGFDDFRRSDFSLVLPLFEEYGATTTYNRIARKTTLSSKDKEVISKIIDFGNELGDHTWYHVNYIFSDPLFNGQDPNDICSGGGEQKPFPSNDQLRKDRGDGKNVFGKNVKETIKRSYDFPLNLGITWENLTDKQCQDIRDYFSIYKDETGLLDTLDELSNRYLGTYGSSRDSWCPATQCYTEGIFTGARTSCNHEIWERILQVTRLFYKDQYDKDFTFLTWSWPGAPRSGCWFEKNGRYYFDESCGIPVNYLAQFPSSVNRDANDFVMRSWVQVLRNAGYKITHDTFYPSRVDGITAPMMSKQLILNASFSRKDALAYSTNRAVHYLKIAKDYPEKFFDKSSQKSIAAQMYDAGGIFYEFIEDMRKNTSNGMVQGEVIDSEDTFSEKIFLQQILEYCKVTGVEVVSHKKAYDLCFNQIHTSGNLLYNPTFSNTAKEFMPDAGNVPSNPDGYLGNCFVHQEGGSKFLVTNGITQYLHYGIPMGKIKYSADISGSGMVRIYAIRNKDEIALDNDNLVLLTSIPVANKKRGNYTVYFEIPDAPETEYEQVCEGLGNKIMGIKVEYSNGLKIGNIDLRLVSAK